MSKASLIAPALILAVKDLRQMMREPAAMFFVLVFPVLFGIIFGLLFSSTGGDDARINVAIVDLDQTDISSSFVERFGSSEAIVIQTFEDETAARDAVRTGRAAASLVLEEGFADGLDSLFGGGGLAIRGAVDPARGPERAMLTGLLREAGFATFATAMIDPDRIRTQTAQGRAALVDSDLAAFDRLTFNAMIVAGERAADMLEASPDAAGDGFAFDPVRVDLEPISADESGSFPSAFAITFPQASAWALLGCVTGFGVSVEAERSAGTLRRLVASPIHPQAIIAGKALACFVMCVAVLVLLQVVGALFFRVIPEQPVKMMVAILVTAFGFVGLMTGLVSIAKSEGVADGFVRGVLLVLALLGGAGVPLAFIQGWMRTMSHVSPFKWAILAQEGAAYRGFSPLEMALPLGVLMLLGVGGLAFAAARARSWIRLG